MDPFRINSRGTYIQNTIQLYCNQISKILSIFKETISTIHTHIYTHIFERRYILLNNFVYFVCQRNQLENGTIIRNCTDADNSNISYFYQMCQRLFVIDLKIKFHGMEKFSYEGGGHSYLR